MQTEIQDPGPGESASKCPPFCGHINLPPFQISLERLDSELTNWVCGLIFPVGGLFDMHIFLKACM